jgi:putative redox protein
MGVVISGEYIGGLDMNMTHELSGVKLMTDPPLDNNGEGKSFSPTDLLATATGSCVMTIMAIYANKNNIDLTGMRCRVEKHMSQQPPRRVAKIDLEIFMPQALSQETRQTLQAVGDTCPVLLSLGHDVVVNKTYKYEV